MWVITFFKRYNLEDSIIICGEPRSGTTWLLELLKNIPNTFIHWEPLHPETGVVPTTWKWGRQAFIPKDDKTKSYFHLIKNILILKKHTKRTLFFWRQSISSLIHSKVVIIKFVRATLLLPYIISNFKLKNNPIFIIRHPIDTCVSLMNASTYFKRVQGEIPDWMNNERFRKEADYLKSLDTPLAYLVAMWCINTCPLLEDKETLSRLNLVFYSDLVLNPEKEIRILLNALSCVKKSDIDSIIKNKDFRKASGTDFNHDLIPNPENQLHKNIIRLTEKEKNEIQQVFDHFDLKLYDAFSVFPKKEMLATINKIYN